MTRPSDKPPLEPPWLPYAKSVRAAVGAAQVLALARLRKIKPPPEIAAQIQRAIEALEAGDPRAGEVAISEALRATQSQIALQGLTEAQDRVATGYRMNPNGWGEGSGRWPKEVYALHQIVVPAAYPCQIKFVRGDDRRPVDITGPLPINPRRKDASLNPIPLLAQDYGRRYNLWHKVGKLKAQGRITRATGRGLVVITEDLRGTLYPLQEAYIDVLRGPEVDSPAAREAVRLLELMEFGVRIGRAVDLVEELEQKAHPRPKGE